LGTPKHMFGYEIQDMMGKRLQVVSGKDYPAAVNRALTKIAGMKPSGKVLVPLRNEVDVITDNWTFEYDREADLQTHIALLQGATLPAGADWRSLGVITVKVSG